MKTPGPAHLAQWIVEAHVRDMEPPADHAELDQVCRHVAAAYQSMRRDDLLRVIGALTDIATDYAYELFSRDGSVDRALALLIDGHRMWAVDQLPAHARDGWHVASPPACEECHDRHFRQAAGHAQDLAWAAITREVALTDSNPYTADCYLDRVDEIFLETDALSEPLLATVDRLLGDYEAAIGESQHEVPSPVHAEGARPLSVRGAIAQRCRRISHITAGALADEGTCESAWKAHDLVVHLHANQGAAGPRH